MKQTIYRWFWLVIVGAWLASLSTAGEPTRVRRYDVGQIEVRVFCDLGVYDDGQGGGVVNIYGMEVDDDGSEHVRWRRYAYRKTALLFPREYLYVPLTADRAYLSFPKEPKTAYWEINRKTGDVVRTGEKEDAFFRKLMAEHQWHRLVIVNRPCHELRPQTMEQVLE